VSSDELYPIIDEVLHKRIHPYTNAGSAWIDIAPFDDVQLKIHELAEALCDAIVKRMAGGPSFAPLRYPLLDACAVADALRYLVINCREELVASLNQCIGEVERMAAGPS
jgi:hypothetical protein